MAEATASGIRDPELVLRRLKDFQRDTVDYVFRRLFLDEPEHTRRFLVADEVGLGKTMVARGVIAKTLAHLRRLQPDLRLDVVYVCSNQTIAKQNINRLNVTTIERAPLPTRLSLLPMHVKALEANPVNFVSLTPGTSLDTAGGGGVKDERVMLWSVVRPELPPWLHEGLTNAFQCSVGRKNWLRMVKEVENDDIDWSLQSAFLSRLIEDEELRGRLHQTCERFMTWRPTEDIHWREGRERNEVIGSLRSLMARVCVEALEPDLIILDEFQRFRDLLTGDSPAAELTRALLDYREDSGHHARTLLLSATPYRMMSLSGDEEDHYADFLETCRFLFDGRDEEVDALEDDLRRLRRGMAAGAAGQGAVDAARQAVEGRLRSVMVRTERVPVSRGQDSMLITAERRVHVTPADLHQARIADGVARHLGVQDIIEYWKSSPYLVNLMGDYQLKRKLREAVESGDLFVGEILRSPNGALLRESWFEEYQEVDPGNARLRALLDDTVEAGLWRLLWMPPSQPYLTPGGEYAEVKGDPTKALVFSTWNVVPDAIAALCSYEAERRIVASAGREMEYSRLNDVVSTPLRFVVRDDRYVGQYSLMPFYPSPTLAALGDPLSLADEGEAFPLDAGVARERVRARVAAALEAVEQEAPTEWEGDEADDQSWIWRRVAHLDRGLANAGAWVSQKNGWQRAVGRRGPDAGEGGLTRHIEHFAEAFGSDVPVPVGPPPDDLVDVLTDLAMGSPAACALRALHRLVPDLPLDDRALLSAAARVAEGFRTLFDLSETVLLLQSDVRYWQRILHYAVDGNLQAVLDEYAHVLVESLGLVDHSPGALLAGVAETMGDVLKVRTSVLSADEIRTTPNGRVELDRFRIRTRFALRFGDLRGENEKTVQRADIVRAAFNSPFRPFVLASTSVGQEGLDFHSYCHAVYHWNLPNNPVDLEQREGRVHRYKSHAVRKNIATVYGGELAGAHSGGCDPWRWMFDRALADRPDDADDLIPYWIYEEGPVRVERRIPLMPLTREVGKLRRLVRSLAVYRMAFGQPRQEDLVELLASQAGDVDGGEMVGWEISLRPPRREGGGAAPEAKAESGPPLIDRLGGSAARSTEEK
jgi:hypothetical protein